MKLRSGTIKRSSESEVAMPNKRLAVQSEPCTEQVHEAMRAEHRQAEFEVFRKHRQRCIAEGKNKRKKSGLMCDSAQVSFLIAIQTDMWEPAFKDKFKCQHCDHELFSLKELNDLLVEYYRDHIDRSESKNCNNSFCSDCFIE